MRKRSPTDLEILEEIYKKYYSEFISFSREKPKRSSKIYVPINIESIAKHFSVDLDIIFGRLYYHLESKYGFAHEDGTKVHFFALQAGSEKHAVHLPLLAAVMARLREEKNKHLSSTWISVVAIIISIISLITSFSLQ